MWSWLASDGALSGASLLKRCSLASRKINPDQPRVLLYATAGTELWSPSTPCSTRAAWSVPRGGRRQPGGHEPHADASAKPSAAIPTLVARRPWPGARHQSPGITRSGARCGRTRRAVVPLGRRRRPALCAAASASAPNHSVGVYGGNRSTPLTSRPRIANYALSRKATAKQYVTEAYKKLPIAPQNPKTP